jgi:hypothetical protein
MKLKLGLEIGDMRCECTLEGDSIEELKALVSPALDSANEQLDAYRNFAERKTKLAAEFEASKNAL